MTRGEWIVLSARVDRVRLLLRRGDLAGAAFYCQAVRSSALRAARLRGRAYDAPPARGAR